MAASFYLSRVVAGGALCQLVRTKTACCDSVGTLRVAARPISRGKARSREWHTHCFVQGMDGVHSRAGDDFDIGPGQVLQAGKQGWAFGPAGPILRAVGVGFGLGLAVMTILTLVGQ